MSSSFRIRIQHQQSKNTWKVRLEFYQDETLREKDGIFQFQPKEFTNLQKLSVKEYGIYLGKALFQNELRDFFISAFQSSTQSMKVALSIQVDDSLESQQLKALHWERLCAPIEESWEYLALNQRLPFAHHVSTGNLRKYSSIQKENLRALILVANPEKLETDYQLAPIDVDATITGIQAALGEIPFDVLANKTQKAIGLPTLKQLREKLSTAVPPYTILHIVSHGRVSENGQTTVYWSNDKNQVEPIRGQYLIQQLGQCENLPHLIFLCCCSSASFFGGLAQSLVRDLATPVVIAMTDKISITTGLELSQNFYPRLQESGEVDVALQRAAAPLAERYDITVPALFSYRMNSSLFGIQVNIVGGKDYALQIFAVANTPENSIKGELYKAQSKITEPYKLLSYYETSDAEIFFGREIISEQLVNKIISYKLVLINGKSGSGKTSLINAGIIPRLVKQSYFTMVFRDYRYPTETIKTALSKLENINIDLRSCQTLLDCIQTTILQTGRSIVIFLDQFERFFINLPEEQWRKFARELKDCLHEFNSQQMNVIISLRVDFYGQLGEFWDEIPELNTESYQQYLKPLNPSEALDAIEKPLERMPEKVGYDSDFLTNCLVPSLLQPTSEESYEQIEPVHLQIVCNQLFEEVKKRYSEQLKAGKIVTIKQDLYEDLGGVEGILQGYVEVILNRLYSRQQQDEVKTVLKQMVNSRGTREFKSVAEIAENLSLDSDRVQKILQQLDSSRLIETVSAEDNSFSKYSITHEYLAKQISQWYTLNELELKRATELYERCLENWKLHKSNRIPRSQLEYLRKYKPTLLKWKPEGKQLFQESEWLYYGLNTVVVGGLLTLVAVTIAALIGQRNAALGEIRASRQTSEALLKTGEQQLDAVIEGLRATTILRQNQMLQLWKPPESYLQLLRGTLWKTIYQTQEQHRLWHEKALTSARFSPNGKLILTASSDRTAKVWNLDGTPLATLTGHEDRVNTASFSPDGTLIVTASLDNTAKIWNLDGTVKQELIGHEDAVIRASFSPDGKSIITASLDNTAKVWNLDGIVKQELTGHENRVNSAIFSPDGNLILTASSDRTAKIWNRDGKLLTTLQHQDVVWRARFSPDGNAIVTASGDNTAKVWNLEGKLLTTLPHQDAVYNARFSSDGQKIVTASSDNTAKVWNLQGQLLTTLQHQNDVNSARFSPDGQTIVTASWDNTAKVWDLEGKLLATLPHRNSVYSPRFSPDGTTIVTASEDHTARVWKLKNEPLATLRHQDQIWSARFSNDGDKIVTASDDNTAKLWNLEGKHLATLSHQDRVTRAKFHPNSQKIVTASYDNTAKVWNLQGELLTTLEHQDEVVDVSFSSDGTLIVTASNDNTAKVWDLTGRLKTTLEHQDQVKTARFSSYDTLIVTASHDRTAKVWNLEGKLLATLKADEWMVTAIFSRDSDKVLTASWDKTAKIWDLDDALPIILEHQMAVTNAEFSPDGRRIVTTSFDSTVRIWNLDGTLRAILEGYQNLINSAEFSGNSDAVVTASDDGMVRISNLDGQELAAITHQESVNSARFNPDGNMIVTASSDRTAKVWEFPSLSELTVQACARVGNYLQYSPEVRKSDRRLCQGIPPSKSP